jgi:hypothetical protein
MSKRKYAVIPCLILWLLLTGGCEQTEEDNDVENHAPVIEYLRASPEVSFDGEEVQLVFSASDPDGDSLTYSFIASLGVVTGVDLDSLYLGSTERGYHVIIMEVSDGAEEITAELVVPFLRSREAAIPTDAVKWTPAMDALPPVTLIDGWSQPEPMPGPINSAGAEDAPFITPDGETFFLFFTPDVTVPPNEQLIDYATGIYWSQFDAGWSAPQRIVLNLDLALDGCPCSLGNRLWFCSARVGNFGEIDYYVAELVDGVWENWQNAGERLNAELSIGELHMLTDDLMYFHWDGEGTYGSNDIWSLEQSGGDWGDPENLGEAVNTAADESRPYVTSDGQELWYTANSEQGYPGPSIWRSLKQDDGSWGAGEEIIASFAGEPTLDAEMNIYFTHHFFDGGEMVEADIYVAWKE